MMNSLEDRIKVLESALRRINKWDGEIPEVLVLLDNDTHTVSVVGTSQGILGEREYMRYIAQEALIESHLIKVNSTMTYYHCTPKE